MKQQFIQDEVWTLVIGGAFQRANIYKDAVSETDKKHFKNKLKGYVDNLAEAYKNNSITETIHIENIEAFSDFTTSFKSILRLGKLNFGVSQKLVNLYLKYQWCLGNIKEPPHFPVDRIIQQKLKCNPIISWTKIEQQKEYILIINKAKQKLGKDHKTLAQLELALFNRRSNG